MDTSEEPLMADDSLNNEVDYEADDAATDALSEAVKPSEAAKPGTFVLLLTLAAGISGLIFGYDTGVVSATLVSIGTSLNDRELTSLDKSVITSSTALFALLVSPFSSVIADKFGRRFVILYADILFVAGTLIQAFSHTVFIMVAGRCVIGAAIGAASFVVPLFLAEVAPSAHRGRLVTTNVLFITMGQMIAYIVGWLFSSFGPAETGWRWLVGLGAIPAVLQGFIIFFMPETPRWLVMVGRRDAAKLVVQRINGDRTAAASRIAEMTIREIEFEAREEQAARQARGHVANGNMDRLGAWKELFSEGKNRRALAITCLLHGLQQLCGFNSLMYFSATIFTLVGFRNPTLAALVVAVTNFIFTLIALNLIDRVGRRRMLLCSLPFMMVGLLLVAFGFSFLRIDAPSEVSTPVTRSIGGLGQESAAIVVLASIMIYVAAYALGLGNVPWMQSELFPLAVRSLGSGLATSTNWTANFVVGLTFLPLMDALSPSWTFILYAGICATGYALVWRIYPETAGLSLEEATTLLDRDWGVR